MQSQPSAEEDQNATIPTSLNVQRVEIPQGTLDTLLAALFFTSIGVFITGNALLASGAVFGRSLPIEATSLGILSLFCALTRILRSPAWALGICYGFLLLAVYGHQPWTIPILLAALVLGAAYVLLRLRLSRRDVLSALGMSAIGTAAILGTRSAYTSFDMIERLHAGNVRLDTLYHASIAAMIKNYGVTSTGLNGLVETPYHALSHALYAGVSLLPRAPVIEVYGVANWVLFAPMLIFSASASCLMLGARARLDPTRVWYSVCALLALTPCVLYRWALWDSYFVSESYLVALSPFLLALPLLLTASLRTGDLLLLGIIAILICAGKAPVGLIFVGLLGIRLVILNGKWKVREVIALFAIAAVCTAVVFRSAVANMTSVWFAPLEFVEQYSFLGEYLRATVGSLSGTGDIGWRTGLLAITSLGSFIALHFFVSWCVAIIAVRRVGIRRALSSPIVILSLGAIFAGMCIVLLFRIFGGSAYYFTNVAFFVSLPVAAALVAEQLGKPRVARWPVMPAVFLSVVAAGGGAFWNASAFSSERAESKHSELIQRLLDARLLAPRNVILEASASVLDSNPFTLCSARPFVFPAVSERPWAGVMVDDASCVYEDYGYDSYRSGGTSNRTLPPRWPAENGSTVKHQALP